MQDKNKRRNDKNVNGYVLCASAEVCQLVNQIFIGDLAFTANFLGKADKLLKTNKVIK